METGIPFDPYYTCEHLWEETRRYKVWTAADTHSPPPSDAPEWASQRCSLCWMRREVMDCGTNKQGEA